MSVSAFRGLNNVTDPLRLGLDWLVQADNVDITDSGAMERRLGYSLAFAGTITGSYATIDGARMYIVDSGTLKAMAGSAAALTLETGLATTPMHWAEINGQVFYNNGADRGIIRADHSVIPWAWARPTAPTLSAATGNLAPGLYQVRCTYTLADGRMTGASDAAEITLAEGEALQITSIPALAGATTNVYIAPAGSTVYQLAATTTAAALTWNAPPDDLGIDLTTASLDPLPLGADVIQFWGGRAYAAMYLPAESATAIWFSQPLGFHLFDLNRDFIMVPGHVHMLAPHEKALVIGTDEDVFAFDGKNLATLAPYGVVAGAHWAEDDARILFWTTRGVCAFAPFSNLTERQVSVAPGVSAGAAVVRHGGQKRYLVALKQGGAAYNSFT